MDFHRFRSLRLVLAKPRIEMDTIIKTHAGVNDSRKASTSLQHHLHFNKSPSKKVAMLPTRVEHEYHNVLGQLIMTHPTQPRYFMNLLKKFT